MSTDTAHGFVPEWTMGDRIRKARRAAGVSQRDLHDALLLAGVDVSAQALGNWESGANDVSAKLRTQVAAVVALLTRVNRAWLLTGTVNPRQGDPDGGSSLPRLDSNQQPSGYPSSLVRSLAEHRERRHPAPVQAEESGVEAA